MIAPMVATIMDHMLNPVTPAPPKMLTTNPPIKAPTIPRRIVTMIPPGSSPGMMSLPSKPAMRPTTIQVMMPIFLLCDERVSTLGRVPTRHADRNLFAGIWPNSRAWLLPVLARSRPLFRRTGPSLVRIAQVDVILMQLELVGVQNPPRFTPVPQSPGPVGWADDL